MSVVIYGGGRVTVEKQLACEHEWHGPCMGDIARFNKCLRCYCVEYDLANEMAYYEAVKAREDYLREHYAND